MTSCEGDYALCIHDWSRINFGGHVSKKDRLQMTHATDIGYELQSSLLVNAQNGLPLSVVARNLVSSEGLWQSRRREMQANDQTHLDELSQRIDWIEQQQFSRRLVHIVDREADSVDHLRQWSRQGQHWLVRVKEGSMVRADQADMFLSAVAQSLPFRQKRQVVCKGQPYVQWIAGTRAVLAHKAKPKRKDGNGQRVKPIAGEPLAVRLVVSRITNADGDVVAQWYLLSNLTDDVECYFRYKPKPSKDGDDKVLATSFNFLGFTHVWVKSRKGWPVVNQQTAKDRLARATKANNQQCRKMRHWSVRDQQQKLCRMLKGHFAYFGISGISKGIGGLKYQATQYWRKWLSRRSSSSKSRISWAAFREILKRFPLPKARIVHSYTNT